MGTNTSKSVQEITTDIMNRSIQSVSESITNTTTASAYSNQTINVNWDGVIMNCAPVFKNIRSATVSAINNSKADFKAELATTVIPEVKTELKTALAQENEGINFGQFNSAMSESDMDTKIQNIVESSIETSVENIVSSSDSSIQSIPVTLRNTTVNCPPGAPQFELTNESITEVIASNMADTMISAAGIVDMRTTVENKGTTDITQKNKGFTIKFGATMVFVLIVAYIIYKLLSGGDSQPMYAPPPNYTQTYQPMSQQHAPAAFQHRQLQQQYAQQQAAAYPAPQQQAAAYPAPQQQVAAYPAPQQQAAVYPAPQQQAAAYPAPQQQASAYIPG
jgi:hypothetical protein